MRVCESPLSAICGHPPLRVRDVTRPLELNLKVELVMGSSRTYKLWPSWRRKKDVNRSGAVVIALIWVASMVIMIAWQPAAPGCAIWPSGKLKRGEGPPKGHPTGQHDVRRRNKGLEADI